MPSKNTPDELLNEGFSPEQFGKTAGDWGAYAQPLLDEVTITVNERVGDTVYASAAPKVANNVMLAERYMACARLCSRRVNRLESSLAQSRQSESLSSLLDEIRKNQRNYESMVEKTLGKLSAVSVAREPTSGPASGVLVSGHTGWT